MGTYCKQRRVSAVCQYQALYSDTCRLLKSSKHEHVVDCTPVEVAGSSEKGS